MAMGAEVAGAQLAALGTGRMRAHMPGGLHLMRVPALGDLQRRVLLAHAC